MNLLEKLKEAFPDSSTNTLRTWIKTGRAKLDEQGQVILGAKTRPLKKGAEIVYEDKYLVVVNKPAGLLSVATEKEPYQNLHNFLKRRFHTPRVIPINRLDRETSGLILFAYSDAMADKLKKQMEERKIQKTYLARLEGRLKEEKGTWNSPLAQRADYHVIVDPEKGKEAITHFSVIKRGDKSTLVRLNLETGRKHQIRVHAAAAGHPIVGDQRYGKGKNLKLHSERLIFTHPMTKRLIDLSASPEKDL